MCFEHDFDKRPKGCALRLLDDTDAMRCPRFGLKKSGSCGPNFLCYVGGASAGVNFHPVSDNLKFFLLSIPVKTCGDHFSRI